MFALYLSLFNFMQPTDVDNDNNIPHCTTATLQFTGYCKVLHNSPAASDRCNTEGS